MLLKIGNFEQSEPEFLTACIERARRLVGDRTDMSVDIHCNHRESRENHGDYGWIEYAIILRNSDHSLNLYVSAIQRKPGEPVEFHS